MLVTTISLVELEPGSYLEWSAASVSTGMSSDVPLSANQGFHLDHLVRQGSDSNEGWLAVAFDVPGPIRRDALTASFEALLRRHENLRCSFEVVDGSIRRRVHAAHEVALLAPGSGVLVATAHAANALLRSQLVRRCDPTRFPAVLFAAIERPQASTVICGFDHSAVDALSLALVAAEVQGDYLARAQGLAPPELAAVGSFLDYCVFEKGQPPARADHPGMEVWRDFLEAAGGSFPSFPLDLGVLQGEVALQHTGVHHLLDEHQADEFEQLVLRHEGSLFTGEVTALTRAVQDLGGPARPRLATLTPVHTRLRPEWEQAVGWFTTNIPLVFTAGSDFQDGVRRNRAAFRAALPAAKIPIGQVLDGHAGPFAFARKDVSMVSHIDYRKIRGPHNDPAVRATHISNSTTADDAQFWFSRTVRGLYLRARYPDTELARRTMAQLHERLTEILREVVSSAQLDTAPR